MRIPIIIISLLLLIPSVFGIMGTRINYDMLDYLPSDIETMKGQNILLDDFGKGAFSFVIFEGMDDKDVVKVKEKISKPINNNKEKAKIEKQIDALMNELEELNNQMNDNENNYDWVEYRTLAHKIKEKEEEIEQLMLKIDSLS